MTVHQLSRDQARRIAVRAQLLDADRPTDLQDVVRRLTLLPIDPTAAVAPSADLVLWTRLGSRYHPDELVAALEGRALVELRALVRPVEDVALHRAEMDLLAGLDEHAQWPPNRELNGWRPSVQRWVRVNDACRRDLLARLDAGGPLTSRELPDTCVQPWTSTGWTNDRNVTQLLELLARRGEVAVAGRRGRERLWDLASRVYPDDPVPPLEQARRTRDELRLRGLGIARSTGPECPVEPVDVGEVGEPAVVEGVRGAWRVDPDQLARLDRPFRGRAALLSPFDGLLQDRRRMAEIFEFEYALEMYKPAAKRRWGYFALPVLVGDRLVGKLDATADRKQGVLRVDAVHQDVRFDRATADAVRAEIEDLARWLDLDLDLDLLSDASD